MARDKKKWLFQGNHKEDECKCIPVTGRVPLLLSRALVHGLREANLQLPTFNCLGVINQKSEWNNFCTLWNVSSIPVVTNGPSSGSNKQLVSVLFAAGCSYLLQKPGLISFCRLSHGYLHHSRVKAAAWRDKPMPGSPMCLMWHAGTLWDDHLQPGWATMASTTAASPE